MAPSAKHVPDRVELAGDRGGVPTGSAFEVPDFLPCSVEKRSRVVSSLVAAALGPSGGASAGSMDTGGDVLAVVHPFRGHREGKLDPPDCPGCEFEIGKVPAGRVRSHQRAGSGLAHPCAS